MMPISGLLEANKILNNHQKADLETQMRLYGVSIFSLFNAMLSQYEIGSATSSKLCHFRCVIFTRPAVAKAIMNNR